MSFTQLHTGIIGAILPRAFCSSSSRVEPQYPRCKRAGSPASLTLQGTYTNSLDGHDNTALHNPFTSRVHMLTPHQDHKVPKRGVQDQRLRTAYPTSKTAFCQQHHSRTVPCLSQRSSPPPVCIISQVVTSISAGLSQTVWHPNKVVGSLEPQLHTGSFIVVADI